MQKRYYVGLNRSSNKRELIYTAYKPTGESFPMYNRILGPFNTRQGAIFIRDYGSNDYKIHYLRSQ